MITEDLKFIIVYGRRMCDGVLFFFDLFYDPFIAVPTPLSDTPPPTGLGEVTGIPISTTGEGCDAGPPPPLRGMPTSTRGSGGRVCTLGGGGGGDDDDDDDVFFSSSSACPNILNNDA